LSVAFGVGGGELVKLMGTSAWYAPGAAAAQMAESIVKDQRRVLPVCMQLDGEYGIKNCYLGVPVILGSATPSLESWRQAQLGNYRLIEMPRRILDRQGQKILGLTT
jgi:hypothetical protein